MKNKRLYCPTLIILYTRERGLRVCARVYYRQVPLLTPRQNIQDQEQIPRNRDS